MITARSRSVCRGVARGRGAGEDPGKVFHLDDAQARARGLQLGKAFAQARLAYHNINIRVSQDIRDFAGFKEVVDWHCDPFGEPYAE